MELQKILHGFNKGKAIFLFPSKQKDLYQLVRQQIVGGPSLVFSRHEKVGGSVTGSEYTTVVSNVGYDANALYLFALGGNIPTGAYTTYRLNSKDVLQPERHYLHVLEREYISFCIKQHQELSPNCRVMCKFLAESIQIGKYLPDASCVSCKIVWEFQGCFFHAHECMTNLVSVSKLIVLD